MGDKYAAKKLKETYGIDYSTSFSLYTYDVNLIDKITRIVEKFCNGYEELVLLEIPNPNLNSLSKIKEILDKNSLGSSRFC